MLARILARETPSRWGGLQVVRGSVAAETEKRRRNSSQWIAFSEAMHHAAADEILVASCSAIEFRGNVPADLEMDRESGQLHASSDGFGQHLDGRSHRRAFLQRKILGATSPKNLIVHARGGAPARPDGRHRYAGRPTRIHKSLMVKALARAGAFRSRRPAWQRRRSLDRFP